MREDILITAMNRSRKENDDLTKQLKFLQYALAANWGTTLTIIVTILTLIS